MRWKPESEPGHFSDFDRLIRLMHQTPTLDAVRGPVKREFTPPNLDISRTFLYTRP